ncbi:MAG: NAD(P)-dependent alcohol dehydrogenase [Pseudomonadota bacterium]
MPVKAYAALEQGAPLEPFEYEPEPLSPNDVEIAVTHCGLCHSDYSMVHNEWGISRYPLVPGHEAVGEVVAAGSAATLKVGTRVGVGWQSGSCGACEWCRTGEEQLCLSQKGTIVHGHGGWAEALRVHERFAVPIPDGLASEDAGPLMCGGITVFSPLTDFNVRSTSHVAVLGIGGLGHLAIQFASAMGCEVTALSSTSEKEAEARSLGAHHFVATKEEGALKACRGRFDMVISTVSANLNWRHYAATLRPKGNLCFVGQTGGNAEIAPAALIAGRKSVSGSPIGSPIALRRMLEFAARNGVKPMREDYAMSEVNAALARMHENKVRYRAVFEIAK